MKFDTLRQSTTTRISAVRKRYRIPESALMVAVFLAIHYILRFEVAEKLQQSNNGRWLNYLPLLEKLSISLAVAMVIVTAGRIAEHWIDRSRNHIGIRYNLVRLTRLITYALVALVGISFIFQNLYAAAVSFGLISLVLGFALQAPITSFIAWLYIIFRHPYHVGDRIQLGELRGDVIEISYLNTLIRECSGIYLGNDRLSGRVIHFPNSIILKSEVVNYSGPFKPFIWNETAIQIAYTSDLAFVEACLTKATDDDFTASYPDHAQTEHQVDSRVYFRVNTYAWLEAVVTYPVEPEDTTGRRNRILRRALPALNAEPDKVQFPKGVLR